MAIIWDIYRNPTKGDFLCVGIAEITTDEHGSDKIIFYKLSTKIKEFSSMTYKQIEAIHEILLKFKTYRPEQGKDGNIMGVMTAYVEYDLFENIQNLLGSDKKK